MAFVEHGLAAPAGEPRPSQAPLEDRYGRRFAYLRLSLTETCNFRCTYCLPNGFRKDANAPSELSAPEIMRAVRAFAALGVWKIRLTGGEPTIRRDFTSIAREIARVPGIRRLAMTTNGYRLAQHANDWREAGIDAINVSIDTLDASRFAAITGHDRLDEVLGGVDAALDAGFAAVKINTVLMREAPDDTLDRVMAHVERRDLSWRFIELMRTTDNVGHHLRQSLRADDLRRALLQRGWQAVPKAPGSGPSIDYRHRDYRGSIGIIAPYSDGFCDGCNRLRLSSRGRLQLCLFGREGADLRPLLQEDAQGGALEESIRKALFLKTESHQLHRGDSGATPHLASIGG